MQVPSNPRSGADYLVSAWQLHATLCNVRSSSFKSSSSIHRTSNMAYWHGFSKSFNVDFPLHRKAQIEDKTRDTLQVIGAGLPRTGTTSLKMALERLGFDPCHHFSAGLQSLTHMTSSNRCLTGMSRLSSEESLFCRLRKTPLPPLSRRIGITS